MKSVIKGNGKLVAIIDLNITGVAVLLSEAGGSSIYMTE